jgi:hypothetical protein
MHLQHRQHVLKQQSFKHVWQQQQQKQQTEFKRRRKTAGAASKPSDVA